MDPFTVLTSIVSSLGISTVTGARLARQLVDHRLEKDLEGYKHDLSTALTDHNDSLDRSRDEWQTALRRDVELRLGDAAADRDYRLTARKRLYEAIGPLRFQLLLACRDLSGRIESHGLNQSSYAMNMAGYYGMSTLYRLVRIVAITELTERQIAFADFAVDPGATDLLRFRRAVINALSDGAIICNHPAANWNTQEQHVFSECANRRQCPHPQGRRL